jgi:dTDP-4-dehydrorhamnose reductase
MATVLVIGARGMLGHAVARAAARRGDTVVGTSRKPLPGLVGFDARRDDPQVLLTAPVDLVVNCVGILAAEIDPADAATVHAAEELNSRFPHVLAASAEAHDSTLVHISTDAVFRDDAGPCSEEDDRFTTDVYGDTKRRGEPTTPAALVLRCSFVGRDPLRGRGLVEWLLSKPDGSVVNGYVDQLWNGLAATQVAAVCAALADRGLFAEARREGPVHHLFGNPPVTKHDLLVQLAALAAKPVRVEPVASGRSVTRVLATSHSVMHECLESGPARPAALAGLFDEEETRYG